MTTPTSTTGHSTTGHSSTLEQLLEQPGGTTEVFESPVSVSTFFTAVRIDREPQRFRAAVLTLLPRLSGSLLGESIVDRHDAALELEQALGELVLADPSLAGDLAEMTHYPALDGSVTGEAIEPRTRAVLLAALVGAVPRAFVLEAAGPSDFPLELKLLSMLADNLVSDIDFLMTLPTIVLIDAHRILSSIEVLRDERTTKDWPLNALVSGRGPGQVLRQALSRKCLQDEISSRSVRAAFGSGFY